MPHIHIILEYMSTLENDPLGNSLRMFWFFNIFWKQLNEAGKNVHESFRGIDCVHVDAKHCTHTCIYAR